MVLSQFTCLIIIVLQVRHCLRGHTTAKTTKKRMRVFSSVCNLLNIFFWLLVFVLFLPVNISIHFRRLSPQLLTASLKGGDPAAPSGTATLLRLHPSHRSYLRRLSPLRVKAPASGTPDSHGVTGGVYKTRERIHPDILIRDY